MEWSLTIKSESDMHETRRANVLLVIYSTVNDEVAYNRIVTFHLSQTIASWMDVLWLMILYLKLIGI